MAVAEAVVEQAGAPVVAVPPLDAPDDYDVEFSRLVAAREPAPKTEQAVTEQKPEAGDDAGDEEKEAAVASAAAAAAEAAAKAKTPEQVEAEEEAALLAALPEDVRPRMEAKLKAAKESEAALQHKLESARGRQSALDKKLAAVQTPAEQQPEKGPGPAEKARWDKFRGDYPDIADAIELKFKEGAAQSAVPRDLLEYVAKQRAAALTQERLNAVSEVHKDFVKLVNLPVFEEWSGKQSAKVQALINSSDTEDVVIAMDLFKAANPQVKDTPGESRASKPAETTPTTPEAKALREKRDAQRAAVEDGKGKGSLPTSLDEDDAEAMFRFYAAKADSRNRR